MSETKLTKDIFETQACSRCGGTGTYSYCQSYGTKCFKCAGAAWEFTKHGKRNYDAWRAAVDAVTIKPASDLKAGDAAKVENDFRKYYRVTAVEGPRESGAHLDSATGQWIPNYVYDVTFDRPVSVPSPLGKITQQTWHVPANGTVRIYPGADLMPQPEAFVTQPKAKREPSAKALAAKAAREAARAEQAAAQAALEAAQAQEREAQAAARAAEREAALEAKRAASGHVGVVGERIELTVTVEHTIRFEPFAYGYAPSTLYLCRDEHGNRIVYKGSGDFLSKGETGTVKATVKEHAEYRGEKQTVLARPKVTARPAGEEIISEAGNLSI